MPQIIKPRRSSVATAVPTTAQLADGEIAVNLADGIAYVRSGAAIVKVGVSQFSQLGGKPTTLAGYGITDAVDRSTAQSIGGAKTFTSIAAFDNGVFMANVGSAPTTPVGGGTMYVEGGALKYKATNGQVTILASAGTGLTITWNPSDKHAEVALSNSNLDAQNSSGTWRSVRGNALHSTLKSYFEVAYVNGASIFAGIADITHDLSTHLGNVTGGTGGHAYAVLDTNKWHGNANSAIFSPGLGVGDTLMVAFDPNTRKLWFGRNGTWVGDPAAGTGEAFTVNAGYTYYPATSVISAGHLSRIRTLASAQSYAPPAGFVAAAG